MMHWEAKIPSSPWRRHDRQEPVVMHSRHLALVFAGLAFLAALAMPAPQTIAQTELAELPDAFVGTWAGTAQQTSPTQQSEYAMQLRLNTGEQFASVGAVDYQGSNWACGGSLVLWLVLDENTVAAGENITSGKETCPNGGFILLTRNDDGTLSYEWRLPGMLDVVTATLESSSE
jgi:hypothetical protein